jgi:nitroreductase
MAEGALSRHTAERLIEAAVAAPSMHNSQPWRFVARLSDRVIEVYADPARTMRRGDPRGRGVHFACGSALFNLRLAIAQAGSEPVARLLPSPRNPLLLATVRLAGPYRPCPAERGLYAAIGRQHPGRMPATSHSPLRGVLTGLKEAAALEGATLRLLDHADARSVLRRSAAADPELRTDPAYLAELAAWTGGLRQGHRPYDAVPGLTRASGNGHPDGRLVMGGFSPQPGGRPAPHAALEAATQLAVISTSADDRASWLRAGEAAQRVMLLATHRGLQAATLTQVLEEQDATLRTDPCLDGEFPAMILRFGYSRQVPPAPRRPVAQVLRMIPPAGLRHGLRHDPGQDKSPGEGPPPALPSGDFHLMPSK